MQTTAKIPLHKDMARGGSHVHLVAEKQLWYNINKS